MSEANDIQQFISDQTDEWATPPEFVRPLSNAVGGFDLDPCSGAETSPIAENVFTKEDDGLAHPWYGHVWLNPPYSDTERWLRKAINQVAEDGVHSVIALVKGDSSTNWWQEYATAGNAIAFVDGRLQFGDGENNAPFASHVVVYGDPPEDVYQILANQGTVLKTSHTATNTEQRELS